MFTKTTRGSDGGLNGAISSVIKTYNGETVGAIGDCLQRLMPIPDIPTGSLMEASGYFMRYFRHPRDGRYRMICGIPDILWKGFANHGFIFIEAENLNEGPWRWCELRQVYEDEMEVFKSLYEQTSL